MPLEFEDDLESMRRRIREEGRERRREELRRRREKREAARRRSSASSSSSSASRDLLMSSSPSRSPSPSPTAAGTAATTAAGGRSPSAAREGSRSPTTSREVAEPRRSIPSESCRAPSLDRGSLVVEKKREAAMKEKKQNDDPVDSDGEDDLAEMSARLAERRRTQAKLLKKENDVNKMPQRGSNLWSDDDSEEEMDVRQIVARKAAEERRRRNSSEATMQSSEKVARDEASRRASSRDEVSDGALKICDNIQAEAKPPAPLRSDHHPQLDECTSSNAVSVAPKQQILRGTESLEVKADPSSLANNSKSRSAGSAFSVSQKSLELNSNSKRGDDRASRRKPRTTNGTLQYPVEPSKPRVVSAAAESVAVSEESPSSMASLRPVISDERAAKPRGVQHAKNTTRKYDIMPAIGSSAKFQSPKALVQSPSPASSNTDPIIGQEVRPRSNVEWSVHKQCLLVRTVGSCSARGKVAGFDLDNTLVNWRCAGWPSRPEHYELWNSAVVERLRRLHDEGYKLVVFSNQGGIRGAFHGKKSATVKNVINWIAELVDRPLFAVCSTKKDAGYHKGEPGMWNVMEDCCNNGKPARPDLSFFVGDADGTGDDSADPQKRRHQQTGTDKLFAENVGKTRNATMEFLTPGECFGPSGADLRRNTTPAAGTPPAPPPRDAILARAALLGGYSNGPILLALVGVQGSGKSTFCRALVDGGGGRWRAFSQDTIRDGRPGTRRAVEEAARAELRGGRNVAIDRTHLDAEQRGHFVRLGKSCGVSVHGLVVVASREEVEDRVKRRKNHPGKVEGVDGARLAAASLSKLKFPTYDEGFDLICYTHQTEGKVLGAYQRVGSNASGKVPKTIDLQNAGTVKLPMITLGTMNMRKQETTAAVSRAMQIGIESIDTAPTYNNESQVGVALKNDGNVTVAIKVPKRCTTKDQAREEVSKSLALLRRSRVDVILLHWPCDLIVADALSSVWEELEAMLEKGMCRAIGVCNFTVAALESLVRDCSVKPALNQVERHPLLPQHDLLEYCDSRGIVVQAHSPLGNGSEVLLENDVVVRVARENGTSPAQVLLHWNMQHGVPVVTKFTSEKHGEEAVVLLREEPKSDLSPPQMKAIDDIGSSADSHRFVAPPFMYRRGAAYSWGDTPPKTW